MGAYIYCARNFYTRLTADATSYTVHATNLNCMMPNEHGIPKAVYLTKAKYKPEKISAKCKCPVCKTYEEKHGTSIKEMADKNKESGLDKFDNSLLSEWLAAHNIYIVEKYIEFLLAMSDSELIEYLVQTAQKKAYLAIKCLDDLVARGRQNFGSRLYKVIQNPKLVIPEWTRNF